MGMVLGILYINAFGIPGSEPDSEAPSAAEEFEEFSEADLLELMQLERLKKKWE